MQGAAVGSPFYMPDALHAPIPAYDGKDVALLLNHVAAV